MKSLKSFPYWLVILLSVTVLLRIPSLFGVYSYGDECIYLTLGQAAREGLTWYRDIHDNKPPLLYLLAMLSGNLFWFRAVLLAWGLATVYLFAKLAKILFPDHDMAVKMTTMTFVILSSLPILEGQTANAEVFMVIFTIAGILRILRGNFSNRAAFGVGILFSLGTLFKVPAATDFVGLIAFLLFFAPQNLKQFKTQIVRIFFLGLGFSVPILFTFAWYALQGAFKPYLIAGFLQNLGYLSTWKGSNVGLYLRTALLLVSFVFLWLARKRFLLNHNLIFIWFAFSLYGAILSDRPYPHYLFQVLPAFCFLIGILFDKTKAGVKVFTIFLLVFACFLYYFSFWHYSTLPYYRNFIIFALGQESKEIYQKNLGAGDNYPIADLIDRNTLKTDKIFVWGETAPCIYALSRRLPVGKYAATYHIIDFDGYLETASALEKQNPRLIIDLNTERNRFPRLSDLIDEKYHLFQRIDQAEIFLLKTSK